MFKYIILIFLSMSVYSNVVTLQDDYLTIRYETKYKSAIMVSYVLSKRDVKKTSIKKRLHFYTDKRLDRRYRVSSRKYRNTGYNRGHLASDASFDFSVSGLRSVYTMANIVPMLPNVNKRAWLKVEKLERAYAKLYNYITVINLVVYDKSNIKKIRDLYIPKGFYKMFTYMDNNKIVKECYYYRNMRNISNRLLDHKVSCNKIDLNKF